jgi:hypothetical protein
VTVHHFAKVTELAKVKTLVPVSSSWTVEHVKPRGKR